MGYYAGQSLEVLMSRTQILSSAVLTLLFASLLPAVSMAQPDQQGYAPPPPAQYAPPPGPPPGYYAPQPYPPQAYAPAAPVGYHEHDGFYMRFLLGPGYMHNSASYLGSSLSISGIGVSLGMAFGGVVSKNLVIYGELAGTSVSDPTYSDDTGSATESGLTVTVAGFGPGVAYYLDNNAYISGTFLFNRVSYSDSNSNNTLGESDIGFGAQFTFGKEWWVSTDWGLGVAGQFGISSIKEKDVDLRWTSITAALMFSATYN
jgi:hypothetical protein